MRPPKADAKKTESVPAYAMPHDAPRPGWASLGNGARKRPIIGLDKDQ